MQETYQRTAAEFLLEVHEEGAQVADSWESMLPLHYAVQNRVRHQCFAPAETRRLKMSRGQAPVGHLRCSSQRRFARVRQAPRGVILLLFSAFQDATRVRDRHERYPYMYTDFKRAESAAAITNAVAVNAAGSGIRKPSS